MPLDPRSRERLEALGRTLPKAIPVPEPVQPKRPDATAPRHAVETEQNPERLFRELMAASADGSVPSHHLDRLRQLEKQRQRIRPTASSQPQAVSGAAAPQGPTPSQAEAGRRSADGTRRRGSGGRINRGVAPGSEEAELYTAFAQLLLEDDELD